MLVSEASVRVFYDEVKETSRRGRDSSCCVPKQPPPQCPSHRTSAPKRWRVPRRGDAPQGQTHHPLGVEARWARMGPISSKEGMHGVPAARRGGRHSNGRTASPIGAVGRQRGGHGNSHTPGAGTAGEREGCETALTRERKE